MRDFTINIYRQLLSALKESGYTFIRLEDYCRGNFDSGKWVILRHDVDARKLNSLAFAQIQSKLCIRGTYYFRVVPESFDVEVMREIYHLGHEIGYHYEDMDLAGGNRQKAYRLFIDHLKQFREVVPISTICMHGSPRSSFDNKDVWLEYNYRGHGIIGEPYFDVNFDEVFYVTDTGRRWDGNKVSVRDAVKTHVHWPSYHNTQEIIHAIHAGSFPRKVMFNFHPQRWDNNYWHWTKELLIQNVKNQFKRIIVSRQVLQV